MLQFTEQDFLLTFGVGEWGCISPLSSYVQSNIFHPLSPHFKRHALIPTNVSYPRQ
jgi:hypothetical protein